MSAFRPFWVVRWLLDPAVLASTVVAALLLAFADIVTDAGTSALLRWLLRVPLAFIATEYALLLMRQAANGQRSPAPIELHNLRFIHGSGVILLAVLWLIGRPQWGWSLVALVLVPAVLAEYAMEQPLAQVLNPVNWVRTYSNLGACSLTLLLSTALLVLAIRSIVDFHYPLFVSYWLLLNVPAAWLLILGRCVYERRLELEFHPRHDPERTAERQRVTDRAQRSRFLDELYASVRANDTVRIRGLLEEHFSVLDPAARQHDAELVQERLHTWGDGAGTVYVRACLEQQLTPAGKRSA